MLETIDRVKELAAERNMTIYQLAETCNVPYQTLKSTEARHGQLKLETIDRICSGLDITLHDFFPEDQ